MTKRRDLVGWLLVGLVTVVAAAAAVLGVSEAPRQASLPQAVANTLGARNYTEDITHVTSQGSEVLHLVFQSPDRLGGYVQESGQRSYVLVIGTTEYQSVTVPEATPKNRLVFYTQPGSSARSNDPLAGYLIQYVRNAKGVRHEGQQYRFALVESGQTGHFVTTVSGPYVSGLSISAPGLTDTITVSSVGTSPPVRIPAGAHVVAGSGTPAPAAPGS